MDGTGFKEGDKGDLPECWVLLKRVDQEVSTGGASSSNSEVQAQVPKQASRRGRKKTASKGKRKSYWKRCPICDTLVSNLGNHSRRHTGEKPFPCSHCGKTFRTPGQRKEHEISVHGKEKPHLCSHCGKAFSLLYIKNRHERRHLQPTLSCEFCGAGFHTWAELSRHTQTHTKEKPYGCQFCAATFRLKTNAKSHERTHTGEKTHPCRFCDKMFGNGTNRFAHEKLVHKMLGEKCRICGKLCASTSARAYHERSRHSSECPPQSCTFCGKGFTSKTELDGHLRGHTGERPFGCDECDKTFSTQGCLTQHKIVHNKNRPYSCTFCQQTFQRRTGQISHEKTHKLDRVRAYECGWCDKTFLGADGLRLHMKTHTGEKPYTCARCQASFKTSSKLDRHARSARCKIMTVTP